MKSSPALCLLVALAVFTKPSSAAITLTATSPWVTGTYIQHFDGTTSGTTGMPVSGSFPWTDNLTVNGWYAQQLDGTTSTLVASSGSDSHGAAISTENLYSFGTGTATNRALGTLVSGSLGPIAYGALFQNKTGATLNLGTLSYKGEQWSDQNTIPQSLTVWYAKSFTPFPKLMPGHPDSVAAVWTQIPALTFTTTVNNGTRVGLDGTVTGTTLNYTFSGLTLRDGEYLALRFSDDTDAGADDALGIDDVTLTYSATTALSGTIPIGSGSYTYLQSFDTLPSSGTLPWVNAGGTVAATLPDWYVQRSTGTTATVIIASTGSSNVPGLYSFGGSGSNERALGSIAGGGEYNDVAYGIQFHNTSGTNVHFGAISYDGEEWHDADSGTQSLTVWYQTSTSSTVSFSPGNNNTGWTAIPGLTFTGPVHTGASHPVDGNNPANRLTLSSTLSGVTLPPNQYLTVRISDINSLALDQGLAADNLALQYGVDAHDLLPRDLYGIWLETNRNQPDVITDLLSGTDASTALPGMFKGVYASFEWSNLEPSDSVSGTNFVGSSLDTEIGEINSYSGSAAPLAVAVSIAVGQMAPDWIYSGTASGTIPHDVPKVAVGSGTGPYTYYPYYLHPDYIAFYNRLIKNLGTYLNTYVPTHYPHVRVAFVSVCCGSTQDEAPYKGIVNDGASTPSRSGTGTDTYNISVTGTAWSTFRLNAFEQYKAAFQPTAGAGTPLLFNRIMGSDDPVAQAWVNTNIPGGWGAKEDAGHCYQLDDSQDMVRDFLPHLINPAHGDFTMFTRCDEDQTWNNFITSGSGNNLFGPNYQALGPNENMSFYWTALEALHCGLSIWTIHGTALHWCNTHNDPETGFMGFWKWAAFFNKYAGQTNPSTATGAFCALRKGLDSNDTKTYPEYIYGNSSSGTADIPRLNNICATGTSQNAHMDDANGVLSGQDTQRTAQIGMDDAGLNIIPGNYERFLHQINPEGTSLAWWRVGATGTNAAHGKDVAGLLPQARFGRGFDYAGGKNEMDFDLDDAFFSGASQHVHILVTYWDKGVGSFDVKYNDNSGHPQQIAYSINLTDTGVWQTSGTEGYQAITNAAFSNAGPNGADISIVNTGTTSPILHMVEVTRDP